MSRKNILIKSFNEMYLDKSIHLEVSNDLISINELNNHGTIRYFDHYSNNSSDLLGRGYGITVTSSEIKLICIKKSDIPKYFHIISNYEGNSTISYYYKFPTNFPFYLVKFENDMKFIQDPLEFLDYKNSDLSDVKNYLIEATSVRQELDNYNITLES